MFVGNVRDDSNIIVHAVDAALSQSVAGCFEQTMRQPGIDHAAQVHLHVRRGRGGRV